MLFFIRLAVLKNSVDFSILLIYVTGGDLLFMHHPLEMECGDPQGKWGQGFVPIKDKYINQIIEKVICLYMSYTTGLS